MSQRFMPGRKLHPLSRPKEEEMIRMGRMTKETSRPPRRREMVVEVNLHAKDAGEKLRKAIEAASSK